MKNIEIPFNPDVQTQSHPHGTYKQQQHTVGDKFNPEVNKPLHTCAGVVS